MLHTLISRLPGLTTIRRTRPWQRPRTSQPRLTRQAPLLSSPAHGADQAVLTVARQSYRLVHPAVALLTVTGRPSCRLVHGRRPQAPPPCLPRRAPRSSGGLVHGSCHEPHSLVRLGKPHYSPASPTAPAPRPPPPGPRPVPAPPLPRAAPRPAPPPGPRAPRAGASPPAHSSHARPSSCVAASRRARAP